MKRFIYFFSVLIIFSSILSCGDKEDPESYEVRKREHRLFRCKVDGKEWTYTGKEYWDLIHHIRSAYYEEDSSLLLDAYYIPDKETEQSITIYSKKGVEIGKNEMSRFTKIRGFTYKNSGRNILRDKPYYIEILDIDTANHIIVGTFEFRAKNTFTKDIISITDGEFDLKMDTWVKK